ncbi:MAG: transporter substrate-binding domain-containing protein, partial [Chloroflexi bacterium]|nr:transporter substrate-binding domain-containing protein [Chloroflexota bacterium]
DDDWARIKAAGKIVVGTSANYPPFEFYDSNYQLDGFDIALFKELGKRLGIEVEFNDFAFDGLLDALRLNQVDAAISAISVTPDRQQLVDFTNLYYVGGSAAVVRIAVTDTIGSATDLRGKKVGVERGTTYQFWAQQNAVDKGVIAQDDLIPYEDTGTLLRDLRNGRIDVALLGLLPASLLVQRFSDVRLAGQDFNTQQFAIAARKGSTLIDQFNQALVAMQADGTFAQLVNQYIQVSAEEATPPEAEAAVENSAAVTTTTEITAAKASSAPPCIFGMSYVADLNLDDKNMTAPPVMALGQDFAKSWRLRNSGTCAWEPDFQLVYVNGNRAEAAMGGSPLAIGQRVEPGATVDLTVSLRAPQSYGAFQGFWMLRDNTGKLFGETIWVGIQIPDPNPPPPPPSTDINPNLRADTDHLNVGQCTAIRWDVDNINAVYFIDNGNAQGVSGHDVRNVCPGNTTTYTLRVIRQDNGAVEFPITVNVAGGAAYSVNFWADSTTIKRNLCTTLRWDVQGVREVYLDNEGVAGVSLRQVCPDRMRTYRLRIVRQDGGQETRDITINVTNEGSQPTGNPDIQEFRAGENSIPLGHCVNLYWRTSNTEGVTLYRGGQTLLERGRTTGDFTDCPSKRGTYDYRLDAYGNGHNSQTVTVKIRDASKDR